MNMNAVDISVAEGNISLPDYYQRLYEELEETGETLCNELKERIVTLKTSVESLKQDVITEKEAWRNEIKETAKLEKEAQQNKWKAYLPQGDYNQQLDMLTTAVLKSHIIMGNQKRKEMEVETFKKKLIEAENICNIEMLKIKQSMDTLKPLQAVVDGWSSSEKHLSGIVENKICNNFVKDKYPTPESEKDSGVSGDEILI